MKRLLCIYCLLQGIISYAQPVIMLKDKDTLIVSLHTAFTSPGATAYDSIDGNLTDSILYTTDIDTAVTGFYTEEYSVKNSRGQTTYKTRYIIILNNIPPPVMNLIGPDTSYIEADRSNSPYIDSGATVAGMSGGLFSSVVMTGKVNTKVPAIYTVTLSVQDIIGNITSLNRTVIVSDTKAPVWQDTVSKYYIWQHRPFYHRVKLTDLCDNSPSVSFSAPTTGPVDVERPGLYEYIYTGRDSSGNPAPELKVRYIVVSDTVGPTLTLKGANPLYVQYYCANRPYTDPGFTAFDAVNGDLTHSVNISGSVNTLKLGTYTIDYTVKDSAGHSAYASRTVIVQDKKAPKLFPQKRTVILILSSVKYYPLKPWVWDDSCETTNLTPVIIFTDVNENKLGTYTEIWQVTDRSGNISEPCTVTVKVNNTVGMTETNRLGLAIFPLPATDLLHVRLANAQIGQAAVFRIFGMDGRLIREWSCVLTEINSLDISYLQAGAYMLQVDICGKKEIVKILKE